MKALNMMVDPVTSHQMEAHVGVAPSWMCVGQGSVRMGCGRGPDGEDNEVHEQQGLERFHDLRLDERDT